MLAASGARAANAPAANVHAANVRAATGPLATGLGKLKHLIFIIQENRSFDSYFGTYPGADGFPSPLPCLPDMWYPSQCDSPYPDHYASNDGGPYDYPHQIAEIDGGKMDGFVVERELELGQQCKPPHRRGDRQRRAHVFDPELGGPATASCTVDVMGYHDGTDLPNYWAYAQNYVLEDQFYESISSWSQPGHLEVFSGWVATCRKLDPPEVDSCDTGTSGKTWFPGDPLPYLWTDITYLLHANGISWTAYLDGGLGDAKFTLHGVPYIWDVLPGFETVSQDGETGNAEVNLTQFYSDAAGGTLPDVSWILPEYGDSEHPQASIKRAQTYLTGLIDAVMSGPEWSSTAIFITHDDIGGFYDHEPPAVTFDKLGLGMRVPSLIVSPYAKAGYIDHQLCSTDCYLKFIEDVFLGGERMSQSGRADPRPDYRDAEPAYGDLAHDFDFVRPPRPPLLLPLEPMSLLR
jgi:phospholipase C